MNLPLRCIINEENLSVAWAKAFLEAVEKHRSDLSPLFLTVHGFERGVVKEDDEIRGALDRNLETDCNTVANTIFPRSLWNPNKSRKQLFDRYLKILPWVRKCPANRYGVYFERLIAFQENVENGNQLEHIIHTYLEGNHRMSALQAIIFDPLRDHTDQRRRGFPCLQSVSFTPIGEKGLSVIGFYPHQYLLARAYGNYLGLCRLGEFVAHEFKRELVEMTCVVGKATVEVPMNTVTQLSQKLKSRLSQLGEGEYK
jgi:hypothetical protein